MSNKDNIGKMVLSPDFGLGEIVGIEEIESAGKSFYVVQHTREKARSFIPMEGTLNYRFLSTTDHINELLKLTDKPVEAQEFESKKDRINYFKTQAKVHDVAEMVKLVLELNALEDRGTVETQIYGRLLDSIILEHSLLFKEQLETSKAFITGKIEGESNA